MLLFALSHAFAHPPLHVELANPTRLSAMQPVGTQAGSGGAVTGSAQYQLYFESAVDGRAYEAVCFAVASGSHTGEHNLAIYDVGLDGRPDALLGFSEPIGIGSGQAVYCADFDADSPVEWNILDEGAFVDGLLTLAQHDAVWLVFERGSGTGTVGYFQMNNSTALALGSAYPGASVVRHLTQSSWSSWQDPAPSLTDTVGGGAVLVSLQVAAP